MCPKSLVGKLEGKRPLGRARCRWEDNTKMDFREIRFGGIDRIHLAPDRDQWWAVVNSKEPFGSIKGGEFE
jgi:hypothetical protein